MFLFLFQRKLCALCLRPKNWTSPLIPTLSTMWSSKAVKRTRIFLCSVLSYFENIQLSLLRGNLLGEDELSGNVFAVNSDGFFGPVCDDGWDNLAAMVVCR